jgi:hypothetical protein
MKHVISGQIPHDLGPPLDGSLIQTSFLMPLGAVVEVVCVHREELAAGG